MRLTHEDLKRTNATLHMYDVLQEAWEQEPNGPEANLTHVLTHLVQDTEKRDFTDTEIAQKEIIPDAMMYALRISRWGVLEPTALSPAQKHVDMADDYAHRHFDAPIGYAAYAAGAAVLSKHLHDLGHTSEAIRALEGQSVALTDTAGLLLHSAQSLREELDITASFQDMFSVRLNALRRRFNIPVPVTDVRCSDMVEKLSCNELS